MDMGSAWMIFTPIHPPARGRNGAARRASEHRSRAAAKWSSLIHLIRLHFISISMARKCQLPLLHSNLLPLSLRRFFHQKRPEMRKPAVRSEDITNEQQRPWSSRDSRHKPPRRVLVPLNNCTENRSREVVRRRREAKNVYPYGFAVREGGLLILPVQGKRRIEGEFPPALCMMMMMMMRSTASLRPLLSPFSVLCVVYRV